MSCNVSLGEYDGDSSTFWVETTPTARKAHKCYECREAIQPGARYQRVVGKWDGRVEAYRFCLPCWEITGEFSESGRSFGSAWEEFESYWEAGANLQACLNRVTTVAAKTKLRDQWVKWKGIR